MFEHQMLEAEISLLTDKIGWLQDKVPQLSNWLTLQVSYGIIILIWYMQLYNFLWKVGNSLYMIELLGKSLTVLFEIVKLQANKLEADINTMRKELEEPTEVEIELKRRLDQLTDHLIQKQSQVYAHYK